MIDKLHHSSNCCIEREVLDVLRHRSDRAVDDSILLGRRLNLLDRVAQLHLLGFRIDDQSPSSIEKISHSVDALHAPGLGRLQWSHEHLVEPQGIGAVLFDNDLWIHDILERLGHLGNDPLQGFARLTVLGVPILVFLY